MSKQKQHYNLRYAMWIAHGKRCVYTGELLQFREVVLDHVIPEHLSHKRSELESVLRRLGLPMDFDIQHPLNLVPTYQEHNNKKHKRVDYEQIQIGLQAARDKLAEVKGIKKKLDDEELLRRNLDRLKSKVAKELIDPSLLYDFWNDESPGFEEMTYLAQQPVNVARSGVAVTCFLPEYPVLSGSLLLRFKHLEVRGCMITFNQKEILELLFQGVETDPRQGARRFIFLYEALNDESIIQLKNNRFTLPRQHTDQLCDVIDVLARIYIDRLWWFESKVFEAISFERATGPGYRLIKISRKLWRLIFKFSHEFEHGTGATEWHIFDPRPNNLQVYCETDNDPRPNYRTIINPEADGDSWRGSFLLPDNHVWLCWDPLILRVHNKDESAIEHGVIWNVKTTYEWLINKLIPRVLEWDESKMRRPLSLFRRKQRADFDISHYYEPSTGLQQIEISKVGDLPALLRVAEILHDFYASWRDVTVSSTAAIGVYESVKWCLKNFKIEAGLLQYIEGNHGAIYFPHSIESGIDKEIENCKQQNGSSGAGLDFALRSLHGILKGGEEKVPPYEVLKAIKDYLAPLCSEYNLQSYRQSLVKM